MRIFVIVLISASAAVADPVPKAMNPDKLYYPIQIGAKKVLVSKSTNLPAANRTETETVEKVEEKDGKFTVTIGRDNGKQKLETVLQVSKDGLYRISTAGQADAEPFPILKLPYKEGTTWTVDLPPPPGLGNLKATRTFTAGKQEEVTVPAGKYKALRLEVEQKLGPNTQFRTMWYAAGIGMIKMESNIETTELKEFTPGKANKK